MVANPTITGGNYGSSANPTADIHLEPQLPALLDNGQHATTALTESYLELNNRRIFEHSLKYKHKITPRDYENKLKLI